MEGLTGASRAAEMMAAKVNRFTLIDVGCSGGIDPTWRFLGHRLHAVAFDPNVQNCRSLVEAETNPNIRYIPAFVRLDDTHPFASRKRGKSTLTRNPWSRLAICKTLELKRTQIEKMTVAEKTALNAWQDVELSADRVSLPEFFASNDISDIDFVKIDIDGEDFDVLNSLSDEFNERCILGMGLEINYVGDDSDTTHTFHNTDRFMRRFGFDLFNLSIRKYSAATIPSRYLYTVPSVSVSGRPLQGDAIYLRDLCAPYNAELATRLSSEKLIKAALLFSVMGLPDHAAEVLLAFRDRVAEVCDVAALLDALVEQAAPSSRMSFKEYHAAFERDDPMFYPPSSERSRLAIMLRLRQLLRRSRRVWRATQAAKSAWRMG
jgi:FkbM family methyltransferase